RLLIAWFGPRGLSSLLLVLLPVFAGVAGSDRLFSICSLVVLVSVVFQGGSPMVLSRAARRRAERESAQRDRDDEPVKVPIDRQESAPNLKSVTDDGQTCEVSCPISISGEDGGGGSGSTKIPSVVGSHSVSIDALHQLCHV